MSQGLAGGPPDEPAVARSRPANRLVAEPAPDNLASDESLVAAARVGDREAYAGLAQRWQRRILALCHARLPQFADAQDAAQETLLRGWIHLPELRDGQRLAAWYRGIAINVCHDATRGRRRRLAVLADHHQANLLARRPIDSQPETGRIEQQEEERELWCALRELDEPLREVILLHYFDSLTYDDMSIWIGVARATVQERLSKARAQLRRRLRPKFPPSS